MKTITDQSCRPEVRKRISAPCVRKINDIQKNRRERFADFKSSSDFCDALHFNSEAAQSPIPMPAAFFMPMADNTSSVPCGALMRPLPQIQGVTQRGAELFSMPEYYLFINFNALQNK